MRRSSSVAVVTAALTLLAGCPPTCQQVCQKLDRCGFDDTIPVLECQLSCEREIQEYKDLEDDASLDAFNAHRICLGNKSCDRIGAGECFDADLFPFEAL